MAHEVRRLRFLQDPPLRERLVRLSHRQQRRKPETRLRPVPRHLEQRGRERPVRPLPLGQQPQILRVPLERAPVRRQSFPLHQVVVGLLLHWRELRERLKSSEQKQPIRRTEIHRRERER